MFTLTSLNSPSTQGHFQMIFYFSGSRSRHNDPLVKIMGSQTKSRLCTAQDDSMDIEENWKNSNPVRDFCEM